MSWPSPLLGAREPGRARRRERGEREHTDRKARQCEHAVRRERPAERHVRREWLAARQHGDEARGDDHARRRRKELRQRHQRPGEPTHELRGERAEDAREHAEPRREEEPCGDHPRRGHRVGERAEEHRERARGREALRGERRAREVDAEDHEVRERAKREAPERLGPPGAPEREAQAQKPPHPRPRVRPRDARHHERESHGQEERVPVVPRAEDLHAPVGHRAEQRHRQRHEHGQANRCRVARLQGLGAQAREQAAFLARHAATSPRARRPSRQTLMKSSSRSCPGRSASS
ncbi:hypothetical protein COLAER_00678 [Collinsella aerofaciens ATCC 25986]|uniref:Uncharacterized protein n=1 Tax=Collinsella aerofaciens (strain ATCC 25986 / DSM 3979 / JCM 10188 / KCTC 3647 / NCTC 11838 / VPI 1003) TaxID=411903 RepID=A4E8D6_COLAA|nr:hypothetical protein COLAER_00678 [Collinsella aerofaciens ATCC 25986]